MRDPKIIKKDRLRYTKNSLSSTLAILAIVFNVLYFVSIYSSDINQYYYNYNIGLSVVYNLLFLLFTFLCSEGIKNYKNSYAFGVIVLGLLQIVRIFEIPTKAHNAVEVVEGVEQLVMSDGQFVFVVIMLSLSCVAAIASGVIGIYKTTVLRAYNKSIGQ